MISNYKTDFVVLLKKEDFYPWLWKAEYGEERDFGENISKL